MRNTFIAIICSFSAACSSTIGGHSGTAAIPTPPETCVTYLSTLSSGGSSTPTPKRIFFVASDGNDSNDGLSESTPWKTIAHVNDTAFVSGDAILFRCDDEFFGQINADQAGVVFGAYGTGTKKPIISGAERLANWTHTKDSIWMTQATLPVKDLFANGVQMTAARYPDTGFIAAKATSGSDTITADGISRPANYWKGTTLRMRTMTFTYEYRTVLSSASNSDGTTTLILESDLDGWLNPGWGFYLDNKFEELDYQGEWFFDPATKNVYFYAPDGVDPNTMTVDGSVTDYGVYGTQSDITVQGLDLRYQAKAALQFVDGPSDIRILSNSILGEWMDGIVIENGCTNCRVDGNTIQDCNAHGIVVTGNNNTISNNTIRNIGLVEGYGHSNTYGAVGIYTFDSSNATISGNTIDGTGCIGIAAIGFYHIVERNIIRNAMLTLGDGAAIYAYGEYETTYGGIWRNNIIENIPGNIVDAAPKGVGLSPGRGIYLDYECHDMTIEGNTIQGAGNAGIYIQYNVYRLDISNNIVYDSGKIGDRSLVEIIQDTTLNYGDITFTGNILYSTLPEMPLFILVQESIGPIVFHNLTIDNNYYANPYTGASDPFRSTAYNPGGVDTPYTMSEWQGLPFGPDAHSTEMKFTQFAPGERHEKLLVNATAAQTSVDISDATYRDLDGNVVGSLTLEPYSSRLLVRE